MDPDDRVILESQCIETSLIVLINRPCVHNFSESDEDQDQAQVKNSSTMDFF